MPEHADVTHGRLRELNLRIVVASLSVVGSLLVAINARTWWAAAVLTLGLLAALLVVSRWTAGRFWRVALPCLAVTAAVWLAGVFVTGNATASYGISVVGTVVVCRVPRHRGAAAAGILAFVAAVVAAKALVSDVDAGRVLLQYGLVAAAVAVVGVVLTFLNQVVSDLTAELARSRHREAELAVMRERVRFAGDLHDIQGHTLHVVKLKTALAGKLLRSDVERAERELREVRALVGDTITQTKELAYAQRRLNLSAELENAKNLFEAAGISVRVHRDSDADGRVGEVLGQVLRETTTNILRHAQAGHVHITVSAAGITITNDGAREAPLAGLGGLAVLRERVAESGGELAVEQQDGRFRTSATFPDRTRDR